MEIFKKIWNKIKNPHGILLILFYIFFVILTVGTITLVIIEPTQTVWHYVLYALSAVTLTYFVYTMIIFVPKMKAGIIKALKKHKFTNKLLADYGYRTIVFSVFSFILNVAYTLGM